MATRRKRRDDDDDDDDESRISQLPKDILQHVLSLLSPKEALQTCLLSKSWRYLGSTLPEVVLDERDYLDFMSALESTLKRYQDHKQSIIYLSVQMFTLDSDSSSIIGKLVMNTNVTTFRFSLTGFLLSPLPRLIFRAESLKEMYLARLILRSNNDKVHFKQLKTLQLVVCCIDNVTFANIISSCPLIENLVLHWCNGLTIDLKNASNHLRRLKSLHLRWVTLSAESFDNLSSYNHFPCLEELILDSCSGIKELFLLSRSIKRLIINDMSFKGEIHAPNILYFEVLINNTVIQPQPPPSISLTTTTTSSWKSHVEMRSRDPLGADCFLKINELLKALTQSQITFKPSYNCFLTHCVHSMGDQTVVEYLDLSISWQFHSFSKYADILSCYFRICRPRYMIGVCSFVTLTSSCKSEIIIEDDTVGRSRQHCFYHQDLEELTCQVWDGNAKEWQQVQVGTLSYQTRHALSEKQEIRYPLKWR